MLKPSLYLSIFISLLIAIKPYSFEALDFFHGYLESLVLTVGLILIIEVSEKRFGFLKKMSEGRIKFIVSLCYLLCMSLIIYAVSGIKFTEAGVVESYPLYTFKHSRSWSGNEISRLFHPAVGIIGFLISALTLVVIKAQTFSPKSWKGYVLNFTPLTLYYALLLVSIACISVPVSGG